MDAILTSRVPAGAGRNAALRAGRAAVAVVAAVVLAGAGCSSYSPAGLRAGASTQDISTRLGPPTAHYARAGAGERLEYARGPYGLHTYMLDVDAQGRLQQWEQVLTEPNFNAIRAGMAEGDVLATIGHPAEVRGPTYPRRDWTVWSYRYETPFCQWFQVTLDGRGQVAEANYGPDPRCSRDSDLNL